MNRNAVVRFTVVVVAMIGAACSNGQPYVGPDGGAAAGGSGHGGAAGKAGTGGTGGASGHTGSGGQAGSGSGGQAGGGSGGQAGSGSGGTGGSVGGHGGSAGAIGTGGSGTGGTSGMGGTAGAGGKGGAGGTTGTGGTAGATATGGSGGVPVSCASTQHSCNNVCFDKTSVQACGTSCMPCQPPANATATCDGTACGFKCNSSTQHACNGACVDNTSVQSCGATSCQACPAVAGATATCDGTKCGYTCTGTTPHDCGGGVCVSTAQCCTNSDCPTNSGGQTGTCDTGLHTCNYNCPSTGNSRSCTVNGTTTCISPSGCCINSDCTGTCKVCNSSHVCVAATSEDDPNGRCAGTCDSSGACVSKKGQLCNTTSAGCITGTQCAPDGYCCDSLCAGPCVACDFQGKQGTCTSLPATSTMPHSGHGTCTGAGTTCGGSCDGAGACSYPTVSCGSASCSGTTYTGTGTCSQGSCAAATPQACAGNLVCSGNACKASCTADADCASGYFCQGGGCHMAAIGVAAGEEHSCAVLTDGRVFCWGKNLDGQLGNGSFNLTGSQSIATPGQVVGLPKPATAVTGGGNQTCALLNDGSVWCWGYNFYGALGNGTTNTTPGTNGLATPVQVIGLPGAATLIAGGGYHVCAVSGGSLYCWGNNNFDELGITGVTTSPTPAQVGAGTLKNVTAVAAGTYHTCALTNGNVYCWGDDEYGQIGDGMTNTFVATPEFITSGAVVGLAAGRNHTCAVYTGGYIYCWGYNGDGQLGRGYFGTADPFGNNTTTPDVAVSGNLTATTVRAGGSTSCALNSDGSVVCWGENDNGECGTGTKTTTSPPGIDAPGTAVSLPLTAKDLAMAGIYAHTCALLKNGSVWCWGFNEYSQLGNSTQVYSASPVQVPGW